MILFGNSPGDLQHRLDMLKSYCDRWTSFQELSIFDQTTAIYHILLSKIYESVCATPHLIVLTALKC